ncbi:hypothetical protein L4174_000470 [Photobacterium sp. CCB-ST2H9]|uniref:hypothetical protein n=1 Tax=Photobacterium sp. CCB-ST2H9 TaxID=2912855 RepID=UPI0020068A96|nr:hypothetical protein [Photobacterium sp. CCB-ST2H9]UTM57405.1 hypothetical protein L4174_000470 [Photobacterium sp. CCB-ST2H9]
MKRRLLSFSFCMMMIPWTSSAANVTPEMLDKQQFQLNQVNYRLDEVLDSLTKYNLAREQYYLGNNGSATLAEAWYQKHLLWLNQMDQLRRQISNHQQLAASDSGAFQVQISTLMNDLYQSQEDARKIYSQARTGLSLLEGIPSYPENYVQELQSVIVALNDNVVLTHQAFQNLNDDFSEQHLKRLDDALLMTREVLKSLINRSKLEFPELTTALQKLSEIFAVDQLLSVPMDRASKHAAYIQSYASRDWFAAESRFQQLEKQYQKDMKLILASPLDNSLKQPGIDFIDAHYAQAKRNIDAYRSRAYAGLYRQYRSITTMYVSQCQDEANYLKYNCSLLKTLVGLDLNSIKGMNLEQQRYLYQQLVRVPQAPYTEISQ